MKVSTIVSFTLFSRSIVTRLWCDERWSMNVATHERQTVVDLVSRFIFGLSRREFSVGVWYIFSNVS